MKKLLLFGLFLGLLFGFMGCATTTLSTSATIHSMAEAIDVLEEVLDQIDEYIAPAVALEEETGISSVNNAKRIGTVTTEKVSFTRNEFLFERQNRNVVSANQQEIYYSLFNPVFLALFAGLQAALESQREGLLETEFTFLYDDGDSFTESERYVVLPFFDAEGFLILRVEYATTNLENTYELGVCVRVGIIEDQVVFQVFAWPVEETDSLEELPTTWAWVEFLEGDQLTYIFREEGAFSWNNYSLQNDASLHLDRDLSEAEFSIEVASAGADAVRESARWIGGNVLTDFDYSYLNDFGTWFSFGMADLTQEFVHLDWNLLEATGWNSALLPDYDMGESMPGTLYLGYDPICEWGEVRGMFSEHQVSLHLRDTWASSEFTVDALDLSEDGLSFPVPENVMDEFLRMRSMVPGGYAEKMVVQSIDLLAEDAMDHLEELVPSNLLEMWVSTWEIADWAE